MEYQINRHIIQRDTAASHFSVFTREYTSSYSGISNEVNASSDNYWLNSNKSHFPENAFDKSCYARRNAKRYDGILYIKALILANQMLFID